MQDELDVLRRQIDAVDERFVELLAERFRITRRVGRIKSERGLPAQDSIREAQIDAKVRRLAAEHELDEGLVSDVLRAVIDRVVAEHLDDVVVEQGRVVAADAVDPLDGHPWLDQLAAEPFMPPGPPPDLTRNEIRELVRRGAVVEVDGVAFGADAIEQACEVVRRLLAEQPDGVTVAQIRDGLGTSRKYVLPLLAHLDATGRTRRRGDLRIAGPRLVVAEGGAG
ncbi:MAG: SelB C-terminal domain-containing protein [Acidimicrobiia bacterium]